MSFQTFAHSVHIALEGCHRHTLRLPPSRTSCSPQASCAKRDGTLVRHGRGMQRGCFVSQKNNGPCLLLFSTKVCSASRRLHATKFPTASMSVSSMDEYSEDRERPRLGFANSQELQDPRLELWAFSAERSLADSHSVDYLPEHRVCSGIKEVYVILFGIGKRESEGIYSLRVGSDNGLPQETIVAFESKDDADRYAVLLEAAMYFMPNVCSISRDKLVRFCSDSGYHCRFEPKGSLLRPPCYTVGVTDWEKSLRLRAGYWSVLEEEPERWCTRNTGSLLCDENSSSYTHLSAQELEAIKAKLETLLPRE